MAANELTVSVPAEMSDDEAITAVSRELGETLAKAVKLQQALAVLLLKRSVDEARAIRKELENN